MFAAQLVEPYFGYRVFVNEAPETSFCFRSGLCILTTSIGHPLHLRTQFPTRLQQVSHGLGGVLSGGKHFIASKLCEAAERFDSIIALFGVIYASDPRALPVIPAGWTEAKKTALPKPLPMRFVSETHF